MTTATTILSASRTKRLASQQAAADQAKQAEPYTPNPYAGSELWRLPRVLAHTGLSASMVYLLAKQGDFPAPFPLVGRTRCWRAADVVAWAESRIAAAQAQGDA